MDQPSTAIQPAGTAGENPLPSNGYIWYAPNGQSLLGWHHQFILHTLATTPGWTIGNYEQVKIFLMYFGPSLGVSQAVLEAIAGEFLSFDDASREAFTRHTPWYPITATYSVHDGAIDSATQAGSAPGVAHDQEMDDLLMSEFLEPSSWDNSSAQATSSLPTSSPMTQEPTRHTVVEHRNEHFSLPTNIDPALLEESINRMHFNIADGLDPMITGSTVFDDTEFLSRSMVSAFPDPQTPPPLPYQSGPIFEAPDEPDFSDSSLSDDPEAEDIPPPTQPDFTPGQVLDPLFPRPANSSTASAPAASDNTDNTKPPTKKHRFRSFIRAAEVANFFAKYKKGEKVPDRFEGYYWYCNHCYKPLPNTDSLSRRIGRFNSKRTAWRHFQSVHNEEFDMFTFPERDRDKFNNQPAKPVPGVNTPFKMQMNPKSVTFNPQVQTIAPGDARLAIQEMQKERKGLRSTAANLPPSKPTTIHEYPDPETTPGSTGYVLPDDLLDECLPDAGANDDIGSDEDYPPPPPRRSTRGRALRKPKSR